MTYLECQTDQFIFSNDLPFFLTDDLLGMMFFVWQENEESEDIGNEKVDVVQVRLLDALQLLRDEVDKHLVEML